MHAIYFQDKKRLKALGVLAATFLGIVILKDLLPHVTNYFREVFYFLTNDTVALLIDTLSNTMIAPLGFLLANYANETQIYKKEFLGQVAFAAVWGALRHYVYAGLSLFDLITTGNVLLKTSLYTIYYILYGGLYAMFSVWLAQICQPKPVCIKTTSGAENFTKKLRALGKDSSIQLNFCLNILNMFNPFVESRPTLAGLLLIQYNVDIIKHVNTHHQKGFFSYVRNVFLPNQKTEIPTLGRESNLS